MTILILLIIMTGFGISLLCFYPWWVAALFFGIPAVLFLTMVLKEERLAATKNSEEIK